MYKVRCVLFDIGGVVIREPWPAIIDAESRFLGMHPAELEERIQPYFDSAAVGSCSLATTYRRFIEETRLSRDPDTALGIHLNTYQREAVIDDEMVRLILATKNTHPVGCLSNTEDEIALFNSRRGLFTMFDRVFLSNELHMKKPDRQIYDEVARRLGLRVESICLVDDVRENVEASGMPGFVYTKGNVAAFATQLYELLAWPQRNGEDTRDINQIRLFPEQ